MTSKRGLGIDLGLHRKLQIGFISKSSRLDMKLNSLLARDLYELAHLHATCQIMNACIRADQERKLLFAVSVVDGLAAPIAVVPFATGQLHKPRAVIPKRKFDFLDQSF